MPQTVDIATRHSHPAAEKLAVDVAHDSTLVVWSCSWTQKYMEEVNRTNG